jgi:hypothetical protein
LDFHAAGFEGVGHVPLPVLWQVYIVRTYIGERFDQRTYLDRIAHDRLPILDNKAELRVMIREH